MNERIRELINEATSFKEGLIEGKYDIEVFDKEKFAELIVRECYHVVVSNPHIGTSLAGANMRKHFGVEE